MTFFWRHVSGCLFIDSEGEALVVYGDDNTIKNSYFKFLKYDLILNLAIKSCMYWPINFINQNQYILSLLLLLVLWL